MIAPSGVCLAVTLSIRNLLLLPMELGYPTPVLSISVLLKQASHV
jgi:hypothetical protein